MKLLIVNDEELTAETMKSDIGWAEYGIDAVYTAYDAAQAKEVIGTEQIDILLCDIEMPGDNGIELLRWVREEGLPIECIFLTCHPSFQSAQEAIKLDCQDYILIPALYEDIGAGVKKVVERIRTEREMRQYVTYGKRAIETKIDEAAKQHGEKKSREKLAGEIERYILAHLGDQELSVNELGSVFYMHPVSLNRNFREEKQIPVSQFILEERMKLAASLLESGRLGVETVALQTGYQSAAGFSNAFKKYYGCSPVNYGKRG